MLFNTTHFFVFLAVVLALFYASPRAFRKYILLAASYFFYGSWNYKFILLLLTLTADRLYGGHLAREDSAGAAAEDRADSQPEREPGIPRASSSTTIFWPAIWPC